MSDATFGAELLMPEGSLFAGPATAVMCRTSDGDLTVLDGHTPLVGDVTPGVVRIERPGEATQDAFVVHGGFLQVATAKGAAVGLVEGDATARTTRVTLLVGIAERVSDVDVARAQAARERASAELSSLGSGDDDEARVAREQAERALARAELRLEAAGGTAPQ